MNRAIIIATTGLLLIWTSSASARDRRSDAPNLVDEPAVDDVFPFRFDPRPVDPNSPIGLSVKRRSAERLQAQGQLEQAIELYEEVLIKQKDLLGERHAETTTTASRLSDACAAFAWRVSASPEADDGDLKNALDLALKAVEHKLTHRSLSVLSWTQYRTRDYEASRKSLKKSVDALTPAYRYPLTAFLYAAADGHDGNEQRARDWFAAGCEMQGGIPERGSESYIVASHVARLLDLPDAWIPEDWSPLHGIEAYGRLIETYPKHGFLYYRRARLFGQLARYQEAIADSKRATELRPENKNYWYWWAMMTLHDGDREKYFEIGEKIIDRFREGSTDTRADLVRYCSLAQGTAAFHEELFEIAESAYHDARYLDSALGIGIAAYRCGRYEDALKWLPDDRPDDRKGLFSLIFRAMAHSQNGERSESRDLLNKARVAIGFWPAKSIEPNITWYPAERCVLQIILEEAEALIGRPSSDAK